MKMPYCCACLSINLTDDEIATVSASVTSQQLKDPLNR